MGTTAKVILIVVAVAIAAWWAPEIGYRMTGDAHSGGPLFGFLVLPLVALLLTILLFAGDPGVTSPAAAGIVAYLLFLAMLAALIALLTSDPVLRALGMDESYRLPTAALILIYLAPVGSLVAAAVTYRRLKRRLLVQALSRTQHC